MLPPLQGGGDVMQSLYFNASLQCSQIQFCLLVYPGELTHSMPYNASLWLLLFSLGQEAFYAVVFSQRQEKALCAFVFRTNQLV